MKKDGILILSVSIVLVVAVFWWSKIHTPVTPAGLLPGTQIGPAPWDPELAYLGDRLAAIGLPKMAEESFTLHIHQHLDIFIYGKKIPLPEGVGLNRIEQFFSPVHVHDSSSIIHIESPVVQAFTLGQFFDVWGVRFTASCIGGYCNDNTNTMTVYSNGSLVTSDPRSLELTPHEEIVITYGTSNELPQPIPSSYIFPPGD